MNHDIVLCLILGIIVLLGHITKRYGTAAIFTFFALLLFGMIALEEKLSPIGNFMGLAFFVALIVKHMRECGRNSPFYKYNPFVADSKIPSKLRLTLLLFSLIVAIVAIWARFFSGQDAHVKKEPSIDKTSSI